MQDEIKKEETVQTENVEVTTESTEPDYKTLAEENLNGWRRAMADYQNIKKENEVKYKTGSEQGQNEVIEKILPIIGYFQKAIENIPVDLETDVKGQQWIAGIKHIQRYFLDAIESFGMVKIQTVGQKFNATEHEAIGEEETEDESGMVIKEVSPGFKKGEKVIMPAKVIVRK